MPARCTKEDLGAAILVEEDRARTKLLSLRGQEVEDDGLARSGRADDREVAEVAFVEVEEIGRGARRLENGDGIAPVVAFSFSDREPVKRHESGRIGRRDQRP